MAPPTLVPDKGTLRHLIQDEGMTHREIAEKYGVARATISAACAKYGLSGTMTRHDDTLPWKVLVRHTRLYPARMLRLLGRRRKGMELNETEDKLLDSFVLTLTNEDAIVAYQPDSDEGFLYIDAKYRDHKDKTLPIRIKELKSTGE